MKSSHLLNLGNPRKVKENLSSILDRAALDSIETEIEGNVLALLGLAKRYYNFARKQSNPNWRQKISRLYYAAYNASRAVRLYVSGDYSTDIRDHQKFERLPNDFPNRAQYVNQIDVLRTRSQYLRLRPRVNSIRLSTWLNEVHRITRGFP